MAKKVVASLQDKSKLRSYAKVVKAVRSAKTGAYTFKEEMVPADQVDNFIKA
ncbi:MAG: hypothetical protein ACI9IP_002696 [Arcticibacterium sp.]|jgi:hypothetical protein